MRAQTVVDTILGEAVHGPREARYADMLGIASVIQNRAVATGVTPEDVISAPNQFDAFGRALPAGVNEYRDLAQQAWNHVQTHGPVIAATYYATPAAVGNLPRGASVEVARSTGHVYRTDPTNQPIVTARGAIAPSPVALEVYHRANNVPTPTPAPRSATPATQQTAQTIAPASPARGPGMAALAPNGIVGRTGTATAPTGPVSFQPDTPAPRGSVSFYNPGQETIAPQVRDAIEVAAGRLGDLGITSGYRSPSYNRSVGGAKRSEHITGRAIDIDMGGMSPTQRQGLVQTLTELGFDAFSTYTRSPNMLHADMRGRYQHNPFANPHFMHDTSKAHMSRAPGWYREMAEYGGTKTPATAPVPVSRQEALSRAAATASRATSSPAAGMQAAAGYRDGSRATATPNVGPAPSSPAGGARAAAEGPAAPMSAPTASIASQAAPGPSSGRVGGVGSPAAGGGFTAPAVATNPADAYRQAAASFADPRAGNVRGIGGMPATAPTLSPGLVAPNLAALPVPAQAVPTTRMATPPAPPAPPVTRAPAPVTRAPAPAMSPQSAPQVSPASGMTMGAGWAPDVRGLPIPSPAYEGYMNDGARAARGQTIATAQETTAPRGGNPFSAIGQTMRGADLGSRAQYAAAGLALGGIPGAVAGGLLGPAVERGLGIDSGQQGGILGGLLGSLFGRQTTGPGSFPAAPYSPAGRQQAAPQITQAMIEGWNSAGLSPSASAAIAEGRAGLY